MNGYELRTFSLPAELEELLAAELWSLGALGFEVREEDAGEFHLDAYFPLPLPEAVQGWDPAPWEARGVRRLATERLEDGDWLATYRAAARPFDVGRSFRIDPRDPQAEEEPAPSGSRRVLRIPARTAFGTGSHESTRLVLGWLEDLDLSGLAVLDVGTGSGILAFAAELLGAGLVVGLDVDAQAVCVARGNARGNALAPKLFAGGVTAVEPSLRFDLALVNVLPENVIDDVPRLSPLLKPGARLISSGNLTSRRDQLLDRWSQCGFRLEDERRAGEWSAFLLSLVDRA